MWPKIRGSEAATPPNLFNFLLGHRKAFPFVRARVLSYISTMKIDLFVRAVREPDKIIKIKRTRTLYFMYMRGRNP
jgi:hypothetical protein